MINELSDRQTGYDKEYRKVEAEVKSLMNTNEWEVVRFKHIDVFVSVEDVETKVNEICAKTFLKNFLVNVKVKQTNPSTITEIWALKIPVSMKYNLEEVYMACAQRCGYIY